MRRQRYGRATSRTTTSASTRITGASAGASIEGRASGPAAAPGAPGDSRDAASLVARAESLIGRLEEALAPRSAETDWKASIAFRWRKRDGRGFVDPVAHVHRINLRDLQGIDEQKHLVEDNTRQFVEGLPANNVLLTGAR